MLPHDRDPVAIIEGQHASRLPDLVPVRIGRMLQSPFTYYRGTAAVMAADLRDAPTTDLDVVACGDAHISNFGFYASPERELVFDLNDFDEAAVAPWEWDVRRLVASVHIGGRDVGLTEEQCREATTHAGDAYRRTLAGALEMTATERYFARADDSEVAVRLGKAGRKTVTKAAAKARGRTSDQVTRKLTTTSDDGQVRIADQKPVLQHVDHATPDELRGLFESYRRTVREDIAFLLGQYQLIDVALRVVGVGSVGTRCYLIALQGPSGEMLFLQAKEAPQSVLVSHGGRPERVPGHGAQTVTSQGHRVVAAQRVLQASSDPFLGWITGWAGERGPSRRRDVDYYWRQFRDMKGSIDPATLDAEQLRLYSGLCAGLLARAHAQSPSAFAISGYLGSSDRFALATARWAAAYADVAEDDFAALDQAVRHGRLAAERGV
ncbi:DUF2252 domain-containing protein [Pseudactinotalea sp.]|uniref:DUF2252 domain-containing protein n=1 Tax=Pseudactinotalea sp. TaxID=1926260 RepID=UPI003B3BA3CD